MTCDIPSRLVSTLPVQVHAFAFCEIQTEWQLAKDGLADAMLVHHVVAGSGTIAVDGQDSLRFGPNCMMIPPRGMQHRIGFAEAIRTVTAEDACRDGLRASRAAPRRRATGDRRRNDPV